MRLVLQNVDCLYADFEKVQFRPAFPRDDDEDRFWNIRVYFDEPTIRKHLLTLPPESQVYLRETADLHIKWVKEQELPFTMGPSRH